MSPSNADVKQSPGDGMNGGLGMTPAEADARLARLENLVQELRDREDIRTAVLAYIHGTDRCDRHMIEDAYHEDAFDDHGTFRGGREEIVDIIASNKNGSINSQHHVGNVLIELHGDAANVESYFIATQVRDINGVIHTRIRGGRYLDRFERRDGRWRIARRFVVEDWSRLDPILQAPPELGDGCRWASRSSEDPSYELSDFRAVRKDTSTRDKDGVMES